MIIYSMWGKKESLKYDLRYVLSVLWGKARRDTLLEMVLHQTVFANLLYFIVLQAIVALIWIFYLTKMFIYNGSFFHHFPFFNYCMIYSNGEITSETKPNLKCPKILRTGQIINTYAPKWTSAVRFTFSLVLAKNLSRVAIKTWHLS